MDLSDMRLGLGLRWRAAAILRLLRPDTRQRLLNQSEAYDRETIAVMERVLMPQSCAIDVGAHTGAILRDIVRIAPRGRHIAVEPLPHLASALRKEFPTVEVHEIAVSDHTGRETFIHVENDPAYSGLRERVYDRADPRLTRIAVRVTRLDDLVSDARRISLIKADIEGGEFDALRGAASIIHRDQPVIVFEAGVKSTGRYGVDPGTFYGMLVDDFGYRVSTMRRWLEGAPAWSRADWVENWNTGKDYCFIAYP